MSRIHRIPPSRSGLGVGTLACALALAWAAGPGAAAASARTLAVLQTAEDTARAVHLLSRATFGVRPEDVAEVLAEGREAWLERQLHPERIAEPALEERLSAFEALATPPHELLVRFQRAAREARRAREAAAEGDSITRRRPVTPAVNPRDLLVELVSAKLVRAVHAERQLEEVMTDFWFNHFNVFFGKGLTRWVIADFEQNAIRPHVFGCFEDLLRATARHPAMLFYLDNWTSGVPDSAAAGARPQRRARGINENYARELLELHTLGVDGGYTQDDVIAVARAFTGWTIRQPTLRTPDREIAFLFYKSMHDRSEKTVLGVTLPANRGVEDGEDVIRLLATHPSTARHLATKLVERFVSDEPDPALVDELTSVYLDTGGDLRAVTRALFTSERFYDEPWRGTKVKTPFELVASALRATHAEIGASRRLVATLRNLGQLPYSEPAPTGFPVSSEDWVNSGAMLARMNFALALAHGRINGVRSDAFRPDNALEDGWLVAMLDSIMPSIDSRTLAENIQADLEAQNGANARRRALVLALGSPEFQRR